MSKSTQAVKGAWLRAAGIILHKKLGSRPWGWMWKPVGSPHGPQSSGSERVWKEAGSRAIESFIPEGTFSSLYDSSQVTSVAPLTFNSEIRRAEDEGKCLLSEILADWASTFMERLNEGT